ncbi:MAG: alpha-glucan family phosphorylase [Candidatus Marinimicrobia bacterium]|nr:alpha-glucan family phosphorylase [Candidatus Neomarinimicrobiota bacterium]
MNRFRKIIVKSIVPEKLKKLEEFSYNLWWSWKPRAQKLFSDLDKDLWYEVKHNPLRMLKEISQNKLNEKSNDTEYVKLFDEVMKEYKHYMSDKNVWFNREYGKQKDFLVAYFCTEFGVHETVPVYSGGLGILAGDHIKTASDLGIPLVGIGLLYKQGYFIQRFNSDGQQESIYPSYDFNELPISLVKDEKNIPLKVSVDLHNRKAYAQIWKLKVGISNIYLLDSDIGENLPEDRILTSQLYGGDNEMRITQEYFLGIAGVRSLRKMKISPTVWHMNEGHSAFLGLERMREFVENGKSFEVAKELVASSSIFTTHTPVPAGHDAFNEDLMKKYFNKFHLKLNIDWERFFGLGRDPVDNKFSMTILAFNLSKAYNGVSKLHGEVSRKIWQDYWKDIPVNEVPINHVTNGIHTETWISKEFRDLYEEFLSKRWFENICDKKMWEKVENIPPEKMWETHIHRKKRLVDIAMKNIEKRNKHNGIPDYITNKIKEQLDPNALFIGFARRFATYKRATLIFRDIERIKRILNNSDRPVVLFFAGKAHPADNPGQEFIKQIYHLSLQEEFLGKINILENYNITLARYLVSGVDVWLNNPRRPREASGTSGEKACVNGVINFSVLDGWWAEGYNQKNGWTIGEDKDYDNDDIQDSDDEASLYFTLENSIIPEYFERKNGNRFSLSWISRMKESIITNSTKFSTCRMLRDYVNDIYIPIFRYKNKMSEKSAVNSSKLVEWKEKINNAWNDIWIREIDGVNKSTNELEVNVKVEVNLNGLNPKDVKTEVFLVQDGYETDPISITELEMIEKKSQDYYIYYGKVEIPKGGIYKYAVRVRPYNKLLHHKFENRQIKWMELAEM